jgi:hypothetical protein
MDETVMDSIVLFPTSVVGSMPRPGFVKDLVFNDDSDISPDELCNEAAAARILRVEFG